MGERLLCKQEVDGSSPFTSTIDHLIDQAKIAAGKRFAVPESGPRKRAVRTAFC